MRLWVLLVPIVLLTAGCLAETPQRGRVESARVVRSGSALELEIDQHLKLSATMLRALSNGVPLRLGYWVVGCGEPAYWQVRHYIELRYAPLRRSYELDLGSRGVRRFVRRSALLAALDRVRVELPAGIDPACTGEVGFALDLTSLPTPLRFPALLQASEWRLVSPSFRWQAAPV